MPAPDAEARPASGNGPSRLRRLVARDPGGLALAKAIRATLVGPTLFFVFIEGFDDPEMATIAIFGALSALVFADFGGTTAERIRAYLALGIGGALVLGLGTAVAGSTPVSVLVAFVVVGCVRFAGNLGPRWKAAVSPLLLALTLGILVPVPGAEVPARMAAWIISVVIAAVAAVLILPKRPSERIDAVCARTARRLAQALRVCLDPSAGPDERAAAKADALLAKQAVAGVAAMPLRPSGPGGPSVARRQIVQRLVRVARLVDDTLALAPVALTDEMRALGESAAATLDHAATVLARAAPPEVLVPDLEARVRLRDHAFARLERLVAEGADPDALLDRVEAGFVARAGSLHADAIARHVAFVAGASDLAAAGAPDFTVPEAGDLARRSLVHHFLTTHAGAGSVWIRDAIRAGVAVSLAVFVAQMLAVDHAFWVALGTISVLRSSALSTGQTAVVASLGTAIGFVVSAALLALIGLEGIGLWIVLVVSVFALAYLPQIAGLAAGQAAFSVAVVALFNIVEPEGWRTGLTRLEDVAIGAAVSAVVALVFWPRDLVPLVAQVVHQVSDRAGVLLCAAVELPPRPAFAAAREELIACEGRARIATVELVEQHPAATAMTLPWITRLSVGEHAGNAAEAIAQISDLVGGDASPSGLTETLRSDAARIAAALAPGVGHESELASPELAATSREAARAMIVSDRARSHAVVRDLLTRDWLLTVAEMVDERP